MTDMQNAIIPHRRGRLIDRTFNDLTSKIDGLHPAVIQPTHRYNKIKSKKQEPPMNLLPSNLKLNEVVARRGPGHR